MMLTMKLGIMIQLLQIQKIKMQKIYNISRLAKVLCCSGNSKNFLLQNQEATVKIPGNPLICAGDKVEINLQSKHLM